ncbi:MAG: DUF3089 domain-containing protein [Bacteroidales bacterium]|nr:DUF3089 domain-containing protein [Bacteroidales bacterium]
MKQKAKITAVVLILLMLFSLTACIEPNNISYSNTGNWAYFENDQTQKSADIFFIAPTVYGGDDTSFNMPMDDITVRANFLGAINMEKGIYDDNARFFAPYYRQARLNVYKLSAKEREQYLALAYSDIKKAFSYYLKNCNEGRPIILAGFSQGADLCIRLMMDYAKDENFQKNLVACYAIGWSITQGELDKYPSLKFAAGEADIGVIISFNSEAENIDESLTIPKGMKTLAINPLNWKTDGTIAEKRLNLGACFTDYDGNINKEIPQLTGAYIDDVRGALKVTEVSAEEYPPVLDIFEEGIYHLYDYQFFYRNLEKNVQTRIEAFEKSKGE